MEREERIEQKLDKVVEHISSIDVTLAEQHISLKEHMRRTALLEQQMRPIEKHVLMVSGVIRFLGLFVAAVSFAAALAEIAMYLHS